MRDAYDAVVIGAGPAGSHSAEIVAKAGFSTLLLEEHSTIGHPVQCSGLVTERVFQYVPRDMVEIRNEVRGAEIYDPEGKALSVDGKETKAYVTSRASIDSASAEMARAAGTEVLTGTRAQKAWRDNGSILIGLEGQRKGTISTKILIGADGVQSNVARWFRIKRPKDIVSGVEHRVRPLRSKQDFVSVFIGRRIAPSFFGWIIPHGEHGGAIGVGTTMSKTPAVRYLEMLERAEPVNSLIKGAKKEDVICGCIPTDLVDRPYTDGVMTVGDAAGQVKPLSGGGIYTGLVAARDCGTTAVEALTGGDWSAGRLAAYGKRVDKSIGAELRLSYRLRKVYKHLTDGQLTELLRYFHEEKLLSLVISHGDIDYPGNLAEVVVRRAPFILKFTQPYLKSLFT